MITYQQAKQTSDMINDLHPCERCAFYTGVKCANKGSCPEHRRWFRISWNAITKQLRKQLNLD